MDASRSLVVKAHELWARGDFDAFLDCLSEDVVHRVNVDSPDVPYSGDTVGREAARQRLRIVRETFEVQAFVIDSMVVEADRVRTNVLAYYVHRRTRERLDMKIRLACHVRAGLISVIEEFHDAAYLVAFERFVAQLQATAAELAEVERISSEASP